MNVRNILISAIISLVVLWFLGAVFVRWQTPHILFKEQYSRTTIPNYGYDLDFVRIDTDNINISIRILDNPSKENAIIYYHGNTGRSNNIIRELQQFGDVYSPAYPGYNESEGSINADVTFESALKAYDYLVEEKGLEPGNITLLGHSMGGSPATYVAKERPGVKKLVLVNTFSSVQSTCFEYLSIFCAFNGDIFNTASFADEVKVPVRIFAYKGDTVVPFEEGEKLIEYFTDTEDKEFIEMDQYTHTFFDYELIGPELN